MKQPDPAQSARAPQRLSPREAYVLARAPIYGVGGNGRATRWLIASENVSDVVNRLLSRGLLYLPSGFAGSMADLTPDGWHAKAARFQGDDR